MKKKLNARNPRTDVAIPGARPPTATATTTSARNANPTERVETSPRNGMNAATTATVPTVARRYPAIKRVPRCERNSRAGGSVGETPKDVRALMPTWYRSPRGATADIANA